MLSCIKERHFPALNQWPLCYHCTTWYCDILGLDLCKISNLSRDMAETCLKCEIFVSRSDSLKKCWLRPMTTLNFYCFLTQSGHPVLKWAVFKFTVFHFKLVTLLFSSIYVLSEVLVVNHGSFLMQRIFSIFSNTSIIKTAHFKAGCPL